MLNQHINAHQSAPLLSNVTDEKLFQLCRQYGEQARTWRQKFAGLLPEVNKRQLYAKKGFHSIFEFAAKLAGMSEEQVRLVLNLERKFEDKPVLQSLLLSGEVSANKLVRVASIATSENQETLAEHVKILPKAALETWVRDNKMEGTDAANTLDIGQATLPTELAAPTKSLHKCLPGHSKTSQLFDDVKLLQKFSEDLKEKLQELDQKGIDINHLLMKLLKKHEAKIEQDKEQIAEEMVDKSHIEKDQKSSKPSRYIPMKIKRLITREHGTQCSIQTCNRPSEHIHHSQRFSLMQHVAPQFTHDPRYLAPLCREHHIIAHSIDLKYHRTRIMALE